MNNICMNLANFMLMCNEQMYCNLKMIPTIRIQCTSLCCLDIYTTVYLVPSIVTFIHFCNFIYICLNVLPVVLEIEISLTQLILSLFL